MNRRTYLGVAGLAVGAFGGGYYAWREYRSPTLPDGMSVDSLYVAEDVLEDGDGLGWKEQTHTVIPDRETAEAELVDTEPTESFVADTNFEDSYLIVVRNGMQSDGELELSSIERVADGICLHAAVTYPYSPVGDDLRTHSLLVRVTDEESAVSETVNVEITGYN